MNSAKFCVAFFASVLCEGAVFAQATRPTESERLGKLETILEEPDLHKVVASLKGGAWPAIQSDAARAVRSAQDRIIQKRRIALALTMLEKINTYEQRNKKLTKDELPRRLALYRELDSNFRSGGGYVNYLLADTVEQLAAAQLLRYLILHPEAVEEAHKWAALRPAPISVGELHGMLQEETRIHLDPATLRRPITDVAAIVLKELDSDVNKLEAGMAPDVHETGALIKDRSIPYFIYRIMETDMLSQTYWVAIRDYVRKGGQVRALRDEVAQAFERTMGDAGADYQFRFFPGGRVRSEHLAKVVEEFGMDDAMPDRLQDILK